MNKSVHSMIQCDFQSKIHKQTVLRMRSVLRATLAHLQPAATTAAAPTISSDDYLAADPRAAAAFPPGFRSHGPEADVDPAAALTMGLSEKEIAHFQEFGFIVKRKLIPAEDLAPWVDNMWAKAIPSCLERSDPTTWVDPQRHDTWGPSPAFAAEVRAFPLIFNHFSTVFRFWLFPRRRSGLAASVGRSRPVMMVEISAGRRSEATLAMSAPPGQYSTKSIIFEQKVHHCWRTVHQFYSLGNGRAHAIPIAT